MTNHAIHAIHATSATPPAMHGAGQSTDLFGVAETGYHRWTRSASGEFIPLAPQSLGEAGLSEKLTESLVLKYLLHVGSASGRNIAEQLAIPFVVLLPELYTLKTDRMVVYKGESTVTDYIYEITELGMDRARRYNRFCSYHGAAPVTLSDYVASVDAQSVRREKPTMAGLKYAFADLVLSEERLFQIGEAMNAGLGFFLYGSPGNGKTSIAERVTAAFGEAIWIPRTVNAGGELIRLFDESNHHELSSEGLLPAGFGESVDSRWVRIRRPTIVAGGELTLDQLEVTINTATGVNEAPLQLKSNCGTLVIDDFGRQRVSPVDLLNRWIVPLEKRLDYLNLASGRKVQAPFDQLIIFSTNLEPRDLVDEAFLRRIPYKIDVSDPTTEQFREVFDRTAKEMNISYQPAAVDRLLEIHFRQAGRQIRFCHARDLLLQVLNACDFREEPLVATDEALDRAVMHFFSTV